MNSTNPTWQNWSQNLVYAPPVGSNYYFMPTNLTELKSVLTAATAAGATIRVTGQRHSQPPLVMNDNRTGGASANCYLVDMSCYKDLGTLGDQHIVLGPGANQVTVNSGVREDELDAFLTKNNLMLQTVTAGGFFSAGGMTAVDVHGGTINAPIFAETASAYTLLLANGTVTTIDKSTPNVGNNSPLQFARVSLGGLGVVTSVVIDVLPRPYGNTMQGSTQELGCKDSASFVTTFKALVAKHTRMETFFNPYATPWVPIAHNFLILAWDQVANPIRLCLILLPILKMPASLLTAHRLSMEQITSHLLSLRNWRLSLQ
jgi:hypothetical protein